MKLYAVLRLDSALVSTDIFGNEHRNELPKGQYAMPVFVNKSDAEEYADGRFAIMEMEATPNPKP